MKQRIYSILPHFFKELALQYYAERLMKFRRGEESSEYIKQAAERETWDRETWEKYQQAELEKILYRAVHQVPYYREYWKKRGYPNNEWKVLKNWPILTKQELRKNNKLFLADDCDASKMYTEYTSGTSGTPIAVWWSKETTMEFYAMFERRIRNLNNVNWDQRYIMLGGRMIIPTSQKKAPYWINNKKMHQLYMSSYHISDATIKEYADAMLKFNPRFMFGYASSMYSLAYFANKHNIKLPKLECAINNAEPLLSHQRELIEKMFQTRIVNTYGMSEIVAGACTIGEDDLVLWPEIGIIEVLNFKSNQPVEYGESGRFILTSLFNKDMPLIRYDVGDSGAVEPCNGHIKYLKITELTGRIDDLIILEDGTRIGRLDPVFKDNFNIKEAQIIQNSHTDFTVKIVPEKNYTDKNQHSIEESLKERIGNCQIKFEYVKSIPRTNTGKFKAVISHVKKQ